MLELYKNIKRLREEKGMSQDALAKLTGYTDRSSITKIEKGQVDLQQSKIELFAKALGTNPGDLMGWTEETHSIPHKSYTDSIYTYDNLYPIELKKFPLLGEIACGEPIFASEDRESYILAGTNIKADFCLKAKGDSMINARIFDGDIVFIREQPSVNDGEIAAVIIEDEATLKRTYFNRENNTLQLVAENPAYRPLIYTGETLNTIRILGKAVAFQSDVR
ncbi:LexA family protein [Diplocloster agilis]|uniref:Helix-turn-helix domain-containing protein n=1 Tax=Diplocloster agilis TaxID=2850323 RepID=A0A949NFU7_9FIRM|nr:MULTISPECIES: S24 family peptidase [Lachnospiraceae]MBU9738871.1 helix-turn-helix domain-containing protein [Diplocloster agilis]MCU6734905.1 helix-turn-helix domain-containing protein [Suonthocola fibrivorans]SCJ58614.1 LexA repressor [uncultured Clostridium sp.]